MKITELIKSKEYKEASKQIAEWKQLIADGDNNMAKDIGKKKNEFFTRMRKNRPDLYAAFQIDDKMLEEAIHKKLTHNDIVIG